MKKQDRYEYIHEELSKICNTKNMSAVDCACSFGKRILLIVDKFKYVKCFDISEKYVKMAKKIGLDAEVSNICDLPLDDNSIDIFICSETLEHLNEEETIMAFNEINRITKKYVVITVPENKKICLKNKLHKQFLTYDDIDRIFVGWNVVKNSVYWKKPKRGNTVVILEKNNEK